MHFPLPVGGAGLAVVNISWDPIPENQWNGIPNGYFVYLFRHPSEESLEVYRVSYPDTNVVVGIPSGRYGIHIVAFNNVSQSDQVLVSGVLMFGNTTSSANSFVDYPFFYILIPGAVCVAIIVVIIIVICKKLKEGKKGSISFARGEWLLIWHSSVKFQCQPPPPSPRVCGVQ